MTLLGFVLPVTVLTHANLRQTEIPFEVDKNDTHTNLRQTEITAEGEQNNLTQLHPNNDFGFVYIGFGQKDWCHETKTSVMSIRRSKLKCRMDKHSPTFCRIAFLGDWDAVQKVNRKCNDQFDVLVTEDLTKCDFAKQTQDKRMWKLCVRAHHIPFKYNIQMDADTYVVSSDVEIVFSALEQGYELAAAFECCAKGHGASGELFSGWEMQTGMIGYTNCPAVRSHAEEAMRLAVIGETHHPTYTSGEQTYETQALKSDAGRVRFFPLPPNYNVKKQTTTGYRSMHPVVLHDQHISQWTESEYDTRSHDLITQYFRWFAGKLADAVL